MIEPIVKVSVYEEIVRQICEKIKSGELELGQQLPGELELSKAYGVSRNCVREALKALAATGIVYSHPGQGTFVREDALRNITHAELVDMFTNKEYLKDIIDARYILEPQIAAMAAERATKEDVEIIFRRLRELEDALIECRMAGITRDKKVDDAGMAFHMAVLDASKNQILSSFLHSLKDELLAQRELVKMEPEDLDEMIEEHRNLYQAIANRDRKAAISAMTMHLEHTFGKLHIKFEKSFD